MAAQRQADARLLCRTLGHAWFPIAADKVAKYGDPMWFRCERCDTERHDDVSRGDGELYGRKYVYADGYLNAWSDMFEDRGPSRSDFRRMLLVDHMLAARAARKKG